mgnify:CR=1 FL=1
MVAIGLDEGRKVSSDTLTVNYYYTKPGKPDKIILASSKMDNGNILITATVVDKNGRRCLDYNKRVYFSADGSGHLLKNYGIPTRSDVIEMANGQASIQFAAVPGRKVVIEARNQDFKGSYLIIEN